jgi:hypothetical protein
MAGFDGGAVRVLRPGPFTWPAMNGLEATPLTEREEYEIHLDADDRPLAPGDPKRVAVVAATAERRRALNASWHLRDLWVSTLAGNPLVAPLLLGELGAIIEVRPVKLYDALYLIPLMLAGGAVVNDSLEVIDVRRAFSEVNSVRRSIGPFVAASTVRSARALYMRYHDHYAPDGRR